MGVIFKRTFRFPPQVFSFSSTKWNPGRPLTLSMKNMDEMTTRFISFFLDTMTMGSGRGKLKQQRKTEG